MEPFCTCAESPDHFIIIAQAFRHAGFDIDWRDVGYMYSDLTDNSVYAQHHAIFFLTEDEDSKKAIKLIDKYKEFYVGDDYE